LRVLYGEGGPASFASVSVLPDNVIRLFYDPAFSPSGSGTSLLYLSQVESDIQQSLSYSYSAPVINYVELTDGTVVPLLTAVDLTGPSDRYLLEMTIDNFTFYRVDIQEFCIVTASLFPDLSIPADFCRGLYNLTALTIPDGILSIGMSFLAGCTSFNAPFSLPSGLASSPGRFMEGCTPFNQPLVLPSGLTSILIGFLLNCSSFNSPLSLPDSLVTLGPDFLCFCTSFNQPLTLPLGLTFLDSTFLYNCTSFNQPLVLPPALGTVGRGFMSNTGSFLGPLDLGSLSATIFNTGGNSALAVVSPSAPAYVSGVGVLGSNASSFLSRFPNECLSIKSRFFSFYCYLAEVIFASFMSISSKTGR
jgi:hypothetical protein